MHCEYGAKTENSRAPCSHERALRAGRREEMSAKTSCETCSYFVYDEDCEYYVCEMDLDEDEMYRFLSSSMDSCPYYRLDDEYAVVRKQM